MGYRDYPKMKKTSIWSDNNALMMLIIINVIVFILLHFIKTIYGLSHIPLEDFTKNTFAFFTMPADFSLFIKQPWSLITAQFTQLNTLLLLSNLFWLWTYGYILQDLAGNRKIIPLYLYGSLAGAAVFLLTYNLVPQMQAHKGTEEFYGAATSIIAIIVAATVISPRYRLFPMIGGGIPLWGLTIVFFIIDLASVSRNPGWLFSHMASATIGFFYGRALLNGYDWGAWMNNFYDRFTNLFNPEKKTRKKNPLKQEVFYNTHGQKPFKKTTNLTQQKVDEILDKINVKGYDRLTEEEKDLLRRASEEEL